MPKLELQAPHCWSAVQLMQLATPTQFTQSLLFVLGVRAP
jgi:hypothetical protein